MAARKLWAAAPAPRFATPSARGPPVAPTEDPDNHGVSSERISSDSGGPIKLFDGLFDDVGNILGKYESIGDELTGGYDCLTQILVAAGVALLDGHSRVAGSDPLYAGARKRIDRSRLAVKLVGR